MKKLLLFLIGICLVLLFCRCPLVDSEYRLECYNLTNDTLMIYLALDFYSAYPDTTLPLTDPSLQILFPYEKGLAYITSDRYEKIIKDLPKDTLSVFFIHVDLSQKYTTWQEIRENCDILKRYDLSLTDLQILNFTIPYPPSKTMKGMKMYPAYEE